MTLGTASFDHFGRWRPPPASPGPLVVAPADDGKRAQRCAGASSSSPHHLKPFVNVTGVYSGLVEVRREYCDAQPSFRVSDQASEPGGDRRRPSRSHCRLQRRRYPLAEPFFTGSTANRREIIGSADQQPMPAAIPQDGTRPARRPGAASRLWSPLAPRSAPRPPAAGRRQLRLAGGRRPCRHRRSASPSTLALKYGAPVQERSPGRTRFTAPPT